MTDPLQQAIERSRAASDWCTTEERVFREALAIADAALASIYKGYPNKTDSIPKKIAKARAEMRKLFEEAPHD